MPRRRPSTPSLSARLKARLRPVKLFLVGFFLAFALISGVSVVPGFLLEDAPPELRHVVAIATQMRQHWLDSTHTGSATLADQLSDWLYTYWPGSGYTPMPLDGLPRTPASWHLARRTLFEQVHHDVPVTLYCRCCYSSDQQINLRSCGLSVLRGDARAARVEVEHVFPASQFGHFRACWRQPEQFRECRQNDGEVLSGRDCCQSVDPSFVTAHNDLHNLFPSVGFINGRRSNYNWGEFTRGERYGQCDMLIDSDRRRAQPPEHARGAIARTMLYMRDTYGFRLSRQDERLYQTWNNIYPPDTWEIERNRRIRSIQGLGNLYIEHYQVL